MGTWCVIEVAFYLNNPLEFEVNMVHTLLCLTIVLVIRREGGHLCYSQKVRAAALLFSDFCLPQFEIAECSLMEGK